jgi:hypothetical protein
MDLPIIVGVLVAGSTACILALLYRNLISPLRVRDVDIGRLNRFSVARYRPMARLLAEEDYTFLAGQKGFNPRLARQLRRERRRVFRSYLNCLKRDFGQFEAAIKVCMITSRVDRPDLAKALLKRRLVFTYALMVTEWGLALHSLGLGTVDVSRLVGSLDGMRIQLGQAALVRQGSLA